MKTIKKFLKRLKNKYEYRYDFLNVFNSPFKIPKFKFYFGDIRMGLPYFLPRKWVKYTKQDCIEALEKEKIIFAKANREIGWNWEHYKGYKKAIPIKYFHWHFTSLGWKTKWDDFRFEWNPILSIVLFGKQFCIWLTPNKEMIDQYWEIWLNYNYKTNKKLSVKERLMELFNKHSCTWIHYKGDEKIKTDYYPLVLKRKYLSIYNNWKLNKVINHAQNIEE